jgi:hypothetical protein
MQAYKSPPDLSALYGDLLKYSSSENNLNRGFGLIGSSISQDANREATLKAFTGEGSGEQGVPGLDGMASTMMELNKAQVAKQQRAATMASLPMIAKRYGLSLEAARYLLDTGKLDAVIAEEEKPNVEIAKDANGQNVVYDKTNVKQLDTFGTLEQPDATADKKNYDVYVADEKARGNTAPLSFNEWDLQARKAAASQTNVNTNLPGQQTAFDKKYGEIMGERLGKLVQKGEAAVGNLDQYNLIEEGLKSGIRTGKLGEAELGVRKLGQALGIEGADNPEKIAGGELIQKVVNRMALEMRNPESGMGMPGSLSDKDLVFLKDAQIGLDTSAKGNELTLEAFRRLERRKIEVAEMAEAYAEKHKTLVGFNNELKTFAEANPVFEGMSTNKTPDEAEMNSLLDKYAPRKK